MNFDVLGGGGVAILERQGRSLEHDDEASEMGASATTRGAAAPDPAVLTELRTIPGVGESISRDLWALGIRSVAALRDRDPEELYARLCHLQGTSIDRCMLYVLRCAVHYASTTVRDPDLLLWWNWTDERMDARRAPRAAGPTA